MNSSPTANIIFDVPAETDEFDGKGHKLSAKALAEGIDQVFLNGGGAIGLEGDWGAGKSSVIKMAEDRLDEIGKEAQPDPVKYHVFTFDLWTHQTDEFRRSFLERFLDFMDTAPFYHEVNIEEQQDKIRNRKKEVTNESRQRYTPAGAILVLLLPFLPIIYAWLNPTAFAPGKVHLFAQILVVLVVAGFLIGLVMIRHQYLQLPKETRSKLKTFSQKFARGASELLVLTKKIDQETSVQWIRDEDPTTVEFQKTFREILSKAQTGTNRLVFVLDNIDRLSDDAVKNAWSEMRSLLTGKQDKTPHGQEHQPVVVIIPYDRRIISRALAEDHEDTDLFAKTFNRILRVSPPLGSHWVGFMEKMLDKAFAKQHDAGATYRLYRLLQFHLQVQEKLATPRRIVSFVNDLGAYWTQWGGELPVESMAVFVLLRQELGTYFAKLGEPTFPLAAYTKISRQEDLLKHLAALYFNVSPGEAEEILLVAPLSRALTSEGPEELERLSKVAGFEKFFSRLLPECLKDHAEDPVMLARAATNIEVVGLTGPLADDVAEQLADYVPAVKDFDLQQDPDVRAGLNAIVAMQHANNLKIAASAVKERIERILQDDDKVTEFDKGVLWTEWVIELGNIIWNRVGSEDAQMFWEMSLPTNEPEFAVGIAYGAEGNEKFRYADIYRAPPPSALVAPLIETISDDASVIADVATEVGSGFKTDARISLLNAIGSHLRSAIIAADQADHLLTASARLAAGGPVDKPMNAALQKLMADGAVLHYLVNSEAPQAAGAGLFLLIRHYGIAAPTPSADPHPVLGSLATALESYSTFATTGEVEDEAISSAANFVADINMFGVWLGYAASQPHSLFDKVVRQMVTTRRLGIVGQVAAKTLIENFEQLQNVFEPEFLAELVGAMGTAMGDESGIQDDALLTIPRGLVDNVEEWAPRSALAALIPRIDALLRSVTADEWEEAFSDGTAEVAMLIIRIEKAGITLGAKDYLEGYKRSALNVLAADHGADLDPEHWNKLYLAVPKASRKVLARGIMTDLPRKGVKPDGTAEFVVKYEELAASLPLEDYPENAVQILLRETVISDHDSVRDYIRSHGKRLKKAVASLQQKRTSDEKAEDALAALEDAIVSLEQAEQNAAWAAEARELLNVPKPQTEAETEDREITE